MSVTNPYKNRAMLPANSDMFFGREKEMRRIEGLLSGDNPQCVSIVGERRIGKSSLANRVFAKVNREDKTIALYLDCDGLSEKCQSKDQFFQLLNKRILENLQGKTQIKKALQIDQSPLFECYFTFKAFIKGCGGKGIKTIIFMDEFEHLPKDEKKNNNRFADDTFFSNLRSMANKPENRLAFATVTKSGLKELTHKSIQSSGFWNIFKTEIIGLLDSESVERLRNYGFEETGLAALKKEDTEKIHYYAGDFPFFNQVACSAVWETTTDSEVTDWDKLEVELLPFYEELWENRTKDEQKLLKSLKNMDFKDDFALKELAERGMVIKDDDLYFPFSDYFSHLIVKQLKVKRKKFSLKTVIFYIKEALGIGKSVKKLAEDKGE